MNCAEIEKHLYDYVTERLDSERRMALEIHFKECDGCFQKLKEFRGALPLLDNWSPPRLPTNFPAQVLNNIETERPWWRKVLDTMFLPLHYKIPLQGIAVAALALFAIVLYRGGIVQEPSTQYRDVKIDSENGRPKSPIVLKVEDIDTTLEKLVKFLNRHDALILKKILLHEGIEITLKIDKSDESSLTGYLRKLGDLSIATDDFRDSQGNIVMIINKNG